MVRLAAILLALAVAVPAIPAAAAPWTVAASDVREAKAPDGTAYRLIIRRPFGPAPEGGWPSLWLLDGDQNFATAADYHARLNRFAAKTVSDGYIIAIVSPDMKRRNFDYTPPTDDPRLKSLSGGMGGAEAFRGFLKAQLAQLGPELALDPAKRALMGHSHGGLFVIDTLLAEPGLFRTYVASSPSLWAAGERIDKGLGDLPTRLGGGTARLILTVGTQEKGGPAGAFDGPAANAALADRLSAVPGLSVRYRPLPHETHGSAILPAIGQALPEVFAR